ncbi:4Fe-4S binding protein [Trichlorobacter lovleyi]|uniref:4Fe-4S dicluster domain-containing protein n=1 Tax=Trichlorobacter lovleyi TaxID=313985 RepID=UPI00223F73FD|nr:4Fe-4S binding protein [Trichlorobacter lovleyi]QOX78565.1 4Fe-4S binding protein [Trichlorobacter lovleyi]
MSTGSTVEITVHEQACRGCEMCVDICPTKVFTFDEEKRLCTVGHAEDCIACLSCAFICPSGAITHANYHQVKNFYRDLEFSKRMGKFL